MIGALLWIPAFAGMTGESFAGMAGESFAGMAGRAFVLGQNDISAIQRCGAASGR